MKIRLFVGSHHPLARRVCVERMRPGSLSGRTTRSDNPTCRRSNASTRRSQLERRIRRRQSAVGGDA